MNIETKTWLEEVERIDSRLLSDFAGSIAALEVSRKNIGGNVLVGGHAGYFPERTLLCTPESSYRKPRPGIQSITGCNPTFYTSPDNSFDIPTVHRLPGQLPYLDGSVINYYASSLQRVLETLPADFFDVVLFFRISKLAEQLYGEDGLMKLIKDKVKQGAYFMGSGAFHDQDINFTPGLKSVRVVRLPNPDYTGFYFNEYNLGFIAQKV